MQKTKCSSALAVLFASSILLSQFCGIIHCNSAWAAIKKSLVGKSAAKGSDVSSSESNDDDKSDESDKAKRKDKKEKEDEPKLSVSEHTININGKPVKYKATAGYMILKDYNEKGRSHSDKSSSDKSDSDKDKDKKKDPKALAKVFFIAYTRDDAGSSAQRPLTFSFNGGPGSASIWLHMGALGPRRAVLSDRGEALPPPYKLEDNNSSWIDLSDLVFIDPVSTGFSRPEPDEDAKKFHGYKEDIESVGEFIRLYITKNQRWTSPKFIVGESYGTTRAAGLSDYLQRRYGIYFNGIALVSSVLNFGTIDFNPGNDLPFALFMPSYTATAWYHKKLPAELQNKALPDLLKDAEQFAANDYLQALFQGDRLSAAKKDEIADRLSSFIGMPSSYVKQLNLRVPDNLFFSRLLCDKDRLIGRYDSRFTGIRYAPGTDDAEFDPSAEAVTGTFTATFNDYVRRELHFESELPYETIANVWPWSWKEAQNRYLDVSADLRKAMSRNPYLKVWLSCGHYDLATPYFSSKYTVDQMALDPSIRKNVRLTYYDSGHMMYIYRPALQKFKSDFESFLKDSILPEASLVPTATP
ncbi:MAG: hypothetical protein K2X27_13115 [Candidatus Obscuribacterales bacterium]|nr:hypothetical protein [Candidatus Obscuribacterales bacterium]